MSILALLMSSVCFAADYDMDCMTLSKYELDGTARYVALGGAMTALGGDASAIMDNPAALGLYRRSELSLTVDLSFTQGEIPTWGLPQVSYIFSSGNHGLLNGVIYNNFVLQFVRHQQYSSLPYLQHTIPTSITDWMAGMAGNLPESAFSGYTWDNEELSWLTCLGYEDGLIAKGENGKWYSTMPLGDVNAHLQKEQNGHSGSVNMAWGTNISNMLYLGLGANIDYWKYRGTTAYEETIDTQHFSLYSYEQISGVGFSGSVGVIYRPISLVRIGASILSPSALTFTKHNWASGGMNKTIYSPTNTYSTQGVLFSSPMRLTAGVALQFNTKGLLSFEYDYHHQVKGLTPDMHWLKMGAEYIVKQHYFLRVGYAVTSPFRASDWGYRPAYNTVCTTLDYTLVHLQQYINAGFGYRCHWLQVETAYQCALTQAKTHFQIDTQAVDVPTARHRIILSISFTRAK